MGLEREGPLLEGIRRQTRQEHGIRKEKKA
jgi:hypothetical protein